jgi:hypothetical protein
MEHYCIIDLRVPELCFSGGEGLGDSMIMGIGICLKLLCRELAFFSIMDATRSLGSCCVLDFLILMLSLM